MHARLSPRRHRFSYRLFLFAVDLDELGILSRQFRLFSVGRRNLFSFRDRDYLPVDEPVHPPPGASRERRVMSDSAGGGTGELKERVLAHLRRHGIELPGGRVLLVTLPRVAGYIFNPVSFYFCFDATGSPTAAIAEVTNTFREVKPFLLGPETRRDDAGGAREPGGRPSRAEFRSRQTKHFYVSPFSDVDVAFDFRLTTPDQRLQIQIDDYTGNERTLTSTLAGPRRELTDARLAWFACRYPLVTLRVVALIHWHALRLWLKRVPWFPKSARAGDQRDLYRPHGSLGPVNPGPQASAPSPPTRPTALAETPC